MVLCITSCTCCKTRIVVRYMYKLSGFLHADIVKISAPRHNVNLFDERLIFSDIYTKKTRIVTIVTLLSDNFTSHIILHIVTSLVVIMLGTQKSCMKHQILYFDIYTGRSNFWQSLFHCDVRCFVLWRQHFTGTCVVSSNGGQKAMRRIILQFIKRL